MSDSLLTMPLTDKESTIFNILQLCDFHKNLHFHETKGPFTVNEALVETDIISEPWSDLFIIPYSFPLISQNQTTIRRGTFYMLIHVTPDVGTITLPLIHENSASTFLQSSVNFGLNITQSKISAICIDNRGITTPELDINVDLAFFK